MIKKFTYSLLIVLATIIRFSDAQNCVAGFTYTLDSAHQIVDFHDTSNVSGHIITYSWDFGDGNTSPHQNSSHSYAHPGTYYVCLTVTVDTPACTNTVCDSIVIPVPSAHCAANFSSHPSVHHMNTINFIDHSTSSQIITSWMWDFGDGDTSTLQNPSHQYADTGSYWVCLITSDAHNLCTDTFCHNVIVTAQSSTCAAAFTSMVDSMGNVDFTNTSTGTGAHTIYHWSFGNGHGSSLENPFHTYFHPGTYYVCLTITDSSCNNTYCDSITISHPVHPSCHAEFQWQQTNQSVNFHDVSGGSFLNYVWDFGDGNGATIDNPNHVYADTGHYTVCLYIADGNCSDSICHNIYVHQVNHCQASFTLAIDTTNGSFNFTNTSSVTATDILWTFGDGDSSTQMNPNHLYTSPGHYTVCLFIHDSISNCSAHSCLVFHSHQPPHHQALSNALFADELTPTGIEQINSQFEFKVYPNPLSTITNIEYTLEGNSKVKWELFNLIGESVLSSNTKTQGAGQYVEQLDVNSIANGTYLVKLFINNQAAISKIIIMK